jgi:hypothetical protein
MKNLLVLNESVRKDSFLKKYKNRFTEEQLNEIIKSIDGKFLEWVGKHLDSINFDTNLIYLSKLINRFKRISSNLIIKDLYQYKNVKQLSDAINEYENKQKRDYKQVKGANVIYNDKKRFIVFNPLTHDSSCYYGSGTKWCTAASTDEHFHRYNNDGKLFYILDRTKQTSDPYYKVAMLLKYNGDTSFFDATDNIFNKGWIFGTKDFNKIEKSIENYMQSNFSDLIEIYKDEIKRKKEEERLRILNQQRIERQRMQQIEERRVNDVWNLDGDCPKIGLMAHAVFRFIKDTENLPEDIDVYNVFPTGDYGQMKRFIIVGVDELFDYEWISGNEYDAEQMALEDIENLYDDIGIKYLPKHLLESNIDEFSVSEDAREYWTDIIYDSPEDYFEESDRELSIEQSTNKQKYQREIESINKVMIEFRKNINSQNEREIYDKIDEFYNRIDELKSEIKNIDENPEGDFPDELIEKEIDDRAIDAKNDPLSFLNMFGVEIDQYVDKNSLYKDILRVDGIENHLYSYNGNVEEIRVKNSWFYVTRIE